MKSDVKFWHDGQSYTMVWKHTIGAHSVVLGHSHTERAVKGKTECVLESITTTIIGHAYCSARERYTKERGRRESLTNALQIGGFSRAARKAAWEAYFARGQQPASKVQEKPAGAADPATLAKAITALVEALGMTAENLLRNANGERMAYNDHAFANLLRRHGLEKLE